MRDLLKVIPDFRDKAGCRVAGFKMPKILFKFPGQNCFQLFKLLLIVSCTLEKDIAVFANNYVSGNILGCIKTEYLAIGIRSKGHSELFAFDKGFDLFFCVFPAEDYKYEIGSVAVLLPDVLLEYRKFCIARTAPGCKKVDHDYLTLRFADVHSLSVICCTNEGWSFGSGLN